MHLWIERHILNSGKTDFQVAQEIRERGHDLSELPPPVEEFQFRDLEGATKEQVKERAEPLVRDLHAFLNQGSCLSDIQSIRREWRLRTRGDLAFGGHDFPTDYEHWYTYNTGGRNEAQFNLGLFPTYLRIGLGFEFTRKNYGDPEHVQAAFGAFREILSQNRGAFNKFAQDNRLRVEWLRADAPRRATLEYLPTRKATEWLLRPRVADWIFVGRLLTREDDMKILGDPVRFKECMESVFGGFKPLWRMAQTEAASWV